jgi:hypothetical protein
MRALFQFLLRILRGPEARVPSPSASDKLDAERARLASRYRV